MWWVDRGRKVYERLFGGYKHPDGMFCRTDDLAHHIEGCDVLVIVAHPDDECLGLGDTLCAHREQGHSVAVLFATDGRGLVGWLRPALESRLVWETRLQESRSALSILGVPPDWVQGLGFPDSGLYRYVPELMTDVAHTIRSVQPKRIYTHAWDGGHMDHDAVGIAVAGACEELEFTELYEFAEYNQYLAEDARGFCFAPHDGMPSHPPEPTSPGRSRKLEMLQFHVSQAGVLARYAHLEEAVRKVTFPYLAPELTRYESLRARVEACWPECCLGRRDRRS